jgi:hypothetical protein
MYIFSAENFEEIFFPKDVGENWNFPKKFRGKFRGKLLSAEKNVQKIGPG